MARHDRLLFFMNVNPPPPEKKRKKPKASLLEHRRALISLVDMLAISDDQPSLLMALERLSRILQLSRSTNLALALDCLLLASCSSLAEGDQQAVAKRHRVAASSVTIQVATWRRRIASWSKRPDR
jgi:hypothetical protein